MEAGELDPWGFPTILTDVVAEIVASHPDHTERARRAAWFGEELTRAVDRYAADYETTPNGAEVLPFSRSEAMEGESPHTTEASCRYRKPLVP
jgi:hypothetical protein